MDKHFLAGFCDMNCRHAFEGTCRRIAGKEKGVDTDQDCPDWQPSTAFDSLQGEFLIDMVEAKARMLCEYYAKRDMPQDLMLRLAESINNLVEILVDRGITNYETPVAAESGNYNLRIYFEEN